MNIFKKFSKMWFMVMLLGFFVAGCASNAQEITGIPDTTAPTVSFTSPASGDVAVPVNRKLSVGFSELMDSATVSTSSFTVRETVSGAVVPGTVFPVGTSATFTPTASLKFSTNYTATIRGGIFGGVKDQAGNRMASDFVFSFATGAVADSIAPTVSVTSPFSTSVAVAVNRKAIVGFSEAIDPATITAVSFSMKETVGGANVPGTVTPIGTSATFAPTTALKFSTNYTATIKGGTVGGVKDLAGNAMAVDFVFTFTTGAIADTIAPTVSVTSPTDTAVAVPVNRILHVGFSEEMEPLTISTATFTLKEFVSNNNVPGTVTRIGTSATFSPLAPLALSTKYAATIKGGALGGVKDLAGNAMAVDFVFTFTTGPTADATAPTLITTGALDGATGLPVNRASTATFSEPMNPATLVSPATSFTVKVTSTSAPVAGVVTYNGNTATFTPNSNLAPNTQYTSTITNVAKDLAGNALISGLRANPWNWTTGPAADTTAPTVTVTNPLNLATNVPVNNSINATFNEAMSLDTMTTANVTVNETGVIGNLLGTVAYDVQNNIATFTPQSNLKPDKSYTVMVTNGAKDLAGNALLVPAVNGLPVPNPWTFRTAATAIVTPPVASILLTAAPFGTFGGSAGMTNTGTLTQIRGDIGTIATGTDSVTGFHDTSGDIYTETPANIGAVNGKIYSCTNSTTGPTSTGTNAVSCSVATQARLDAEAAYIALAAKATTADPGENLGGLTLPAGVYKTTSGKFLIDGSDLTLDGGGDVNAVFVFQMATTLTVGASGAPRSIILFNGAQAKNVFWQVGSSATINPGGGGTMVGSILAQQGVAFSTVGSVNILTLNGRALSLIASVTLVNTVINVPQ